MLILDNLPDSLTLLERREVKRKILAAMSSGAKPLIDIAAKIMSGDYSASETLHNASMLGADAVSPAKVLDQKELIINEIAKYLKGNAQQARNSYWGQHGTTIHVSQEEAEKRNTEAEPAKTVIIGNILVRHQWIPRLKKWAVFYNDGNAWFSGYIFPKPEKPEKKAASSSPRKAAPVDTNSADFRAWKEDADMPEYKDGEWVDLETGLPYSPSRGGASSSPRYQPSDAVKAARSYIAELGGSSLSGTPKQKEWGEKIRLEKIKDMTDKKAIALLLGVHDDAKKAAFWIEKRNASPAELEGWVLRKYG